MSVKKKHNSSLSRALKDMPSLLMQEREADQREQTHDTKLIRVPVYHSSPQSARWMWSGVTIIMLAIVGLWMLNISGLMFDNKHTTDDTEYLLQNSKADISSIIATFSEHEQALAATPTTTTESATVTSSQKTVEETLQELFQTSTTTVTTTTPQ